MQCKLMEIIPTFISMLLFYLSSDRSFIKALFVEETSHFRLSCPEVSYTQRIVVNYRNNTSETIAVFTLSECNVPRGDIRCFKLDNINVVEIEVTNQTRTIVSYSCGASAVSNITFYARPSNVSCGPPELDDSGTKVLVTCTVGKVYPQPGCVFYDTRNESIVDGTKVPVKYVLWGSPVYYKAECAVQMEVPEETQVYQDIHVNVYPEIFNFNGAMYGVNYTVAPPVIIEPLNLTIDSSCPQGNSVKDGYIKAWTSATCACLKTSPATVLGRALWYQDNQQVPANVTHSSSSVLTVSYPKDIDKTYQCKGSPLSSDPRGISFSPKFAYGPQNIFSDVTQITIDLCSKESKSIPINVWVPKRDVRPDVRVKAAVELTVKSSTNRNEAYDVSVRTNDNPTSPNITSTIFLTVTFGGMYVVTATFLNTIYSDLSAGTNINVTVREPPNQPPIFIINGGESIIEGITTSNVNLTCYAPGGYPEVSEITISCVGRSTTISGNKLTAKMDFDKHDNGSICTCHATHSSGCYSNNMVAAIVNITYIVNITSFTANNQTKLEIQEGQPVTLSCSAESYPKPVFSIDMSDARSNEVMLIISETTEMEANIWRCKYTLPSVKCEDVKNYTCRATHIHSNITVENTVFLSVKCPFRVTNSSMVQQQVGVDLGQDLVLTVDVLGNPPPSTYELLRGLNKYPVENGSFHVGFTPLNHPYGILKLTLFNVQREDMTLFSLVVDNGMLENMTYSFLVFENTGNQGPDVAAIVGGVLGGVIFIIMVIIGLFMYRNSKFYYF
ncbi:unnamed protein product [Lymnaea stagnalis]|uniref:Ig-like domain-containing protein n=1 Tax=Lymnaea stagnalis TaxID=6523 RepID=A0AAV2HRI2_LYMST